MRGLGTDIVAVPRLARLLDRHGDRFLERCFRPGEMSFLREIDPVPEAAAAFGWAAKEAFLKALGTRVTAIPYGEIEVTAGAGGRPALTLHGRARAALAAAGARQADLSVSRSGDFALATVILQGA